MRSLYHLYFHIKRYGLNHKPLYVMSLVLFFWATFDGIVSFISPIVITQAGFTNTVMGIIIGTSSIAGALFDFFLSRFLQQSHFRRLYLGMFAICFIFPLILWQAKTIPMFLISMALWGLYYDFQRLGSFDFVGREVEKDQHVSSFGVLTVFKSLGYFVAPILVGFLTIELGNFLPFALSWVFLIFAFIFFLALLYLTKGTGEHMRLVTYRSVGTFLEVKLWKEIGKILLPVLFFTMLMSIYDAFFWTIGPIFSESFRGIHPFNGLFLAVYSLPPLLAGWFVGNITSRLGKKKTAFISFALGSLVLVAFSFFTSPIVILLVIFVSSALTAISWPAIHGAYADYIQESARFEKEIEGLADFATNIGYIFGPILAGLLSDKVGYAHSFSLMGISGLIITVIIARLTPKEIKVRIHSGIV
ncbi:MAG: MFS transporter [bacterium]|nr:MFS transporter [bacterium]